MSKREEFRAAWGFVRKYDMTRSGLCDAQLSHCQKLAVKCYGDRLCAQQRQRRAENAVGGEYLNDKRNELAMIKMFV